MNDVLRIARLKIALQRAFLGRAILRVICPASLDFTPDIGKQPRALRLIESASTTTSHGLLEKNSASPKTSLFFSDTLH